MNIEGLLLAGIAFGAILIARLQGNFAATPVPWYRDAVVLMMLPWLMGAIVYAMPIFSYREPLEIRHVTYIGACQLMFVMGVLIVRVFAPGQSARGGAEAAEMQAESVRVLWAVALAGLIGQGLALLGGVLSTRATLLEIVSGEVLARMRLRTQYLAQGYGGSPFVRFNFLGAGGFVFLFMYAGGCVARSRMTTSARRLMSVMAWSIGLMIVFNALFIRGGRMDLVLLMIGMVLAALLDTDRHTVVKVGALFRRARVAWTLALVVALSGSSWYLATSFTKSRIGTADAYTALESYHRASPLRDLEYLTAGNESLEFAVLNLSYFSVPLTTFGYYFDLGHAMFPGPYWGQYNFTGPVTFVMRRIGLREEQQTMQEIRRDATIDLRMRGYGENVWSTSLRDLAFDFGWWGVLPMMVLIGIWSQRALLTTGLRKGGIMMGLTPLLALFLIMTPAHSLFVLESFAVAFYFCLFVLAIQATANAFKPRRALMAVPEARTGGVVRFRQS